MSKTLLLNIPDTSELVHQIGEASPFCLWQVAEKPLLHHWFDFAVDKRFAVVELHCPLPLLDKLERAVAGLTLWPIEIRLQPAGGEPGFLVDSLPHTELGLKAARTGQDLLVHHSWLVRQRLDRIWKTIVPDHPHYVVGRGSRIHPSVELEGPYWIGRNCHIEKGARIGPFTSIGDGAVLGEGISIEFSSVSPGIQLAPNLRFRGHQLFRDRIFNFRRGILHALGDLSLVTPAGA